jgi:hypothetical protein
VLSDLSVGPLAIALDVTYLYWVGEGLLGRVPKDGGDSFPLTTSNATGIYGGITVHSDSVYWTDTWALDNTVNQLALSTQTAVVLVTGADGVSGVAADATRVYWGSITHDSGFVNSMPSWGGPLQIVASTAGDSGSVPIALAVDETTVYWTDARGDLSSAPKSGGPATVLAIGVDLPASTEVAYWPAGIAVDGSHVYWSDCPLGAPARLRSVAKGGGPVTTLASDAGGCFSGLTIDATHAYWVDWRKSTVSMVGLQAAEVTVLATGQSSPVGPVVDETSVYWGVTVLAPAPPGAGYPLQKSVGGQIVRLAKCGCNG